MLYTKAGDKGSTTLYGSDERISKNAPAIEALGTLDELGALLGVCKAKSREDLRPLLEELQNDLFMIQAEVAGSAKKLSPARTEALSDETDLIEKILEPISTFFIAGATELSALFDLARTVARRAERTLVAYRDSGVGKNGDDLVSETVLSYINRLSSLLYAFARREAQMSGIKEKPPKYT